MNSGKALALRFEHWTPKFDCKVTGNKERTKKINRTKKKFTKKLKISNLKLFRMKVSSLLPVTYQSPFGVHCSNLKARALPEFI